MRLWDDKGRLAPVILEGKTSMETQAIDVQKPDQAKHWTRLPVRRGFDSVRKIYNDVLYPNKGYIAGSYAAFMATRHDTPVLPNDIDIFATSNEHAYQIMHDLYDGPFSVDENEVAITITRGKGQMQIQIVKPHPEWKHFPVDIINSFDLDISRALLLSPSMVLADKNVGYSDGKLLRINNPLKSLKRVMKYAARGIEFNDHELYKLFAAWDQVKPEKKKELLEEAHQATLPRDYPCYAWGYDYDFYDEDDYFDGE